MKNQTNYIVIRYVIAALLVIKIASVQAQDKVPLSNFFNDIGNYSPNQNQYLQLSNTNRVDSIDMVFVIDRSASMAGHNKIEDAKIAAKMLVGIMRFGDAVGIVSFNDSAHTEFSLKTIESETTKMDAQSAIDSIIAEGSTSIGAGIQLGQNELNKGKMNHQRAILLLSDGKENVSPFVKNILQTIPTETDIYVIGLGWNADGALLNQVAATTGGIYIFAQSSSELQQIFLLLRGYIRKHQTLSNFTGTISQGGIQFHSTTLDALTSLAAFFITFPRGDVDLELITPGGNLLNPQVAIVDPNIVYFEGSTFDFYIINSPEAGQWKLKVSGTNVPYPESYSGTVQVSSDLKIKVLLDKNEYSTGEPILMTANLNENLQPIFNATIKASVMIPVQGPISDNPQSRFETKTITLFDDGMHNDGILNDGVYSNYVTNTAIDGNYTFTIQASGSAPKGGKFMRETRMSTFVTPSSAPAVVSIFPDSGRQAETLNLSINGANFANEASVVFSGNGITIESVAVVSTNEIMVKIAISPDAPLGFQNVTVTNSDGQQGFGPCLFFVSAQPTHFELLQNYPNPFNSTTTIRYNLPNPAKVKLQILNTIGQRVKTLVDSDQPAGAKSVIWDSLDDEGRQLPSGVYFYQLLTPDFKHTKKGLLLK